MNGHLWSWWFEESVVRCNCGWWAKTLDQAQGLQLHDAHEVAERVMEAQDDLPQESNH